MFIIRIAKETPSGYEPKYLIRKVISPHPNANIIFPLLVIGVVNSLLPAKYWLRYVFNCISIFSRFQTYVNGYFDIASVLYYLSVSAVFIYLTIRVYDRRRYD